MRLSWEEAEVAALDRHGWRRSVAQCVHMDVGRIKVKVKVKVRDLANRLMTPTNFPPWWHT